MSLQIMRIRGFCIFCACIVSSFFVTWSVDAGALAVDKHNVSDSIKSKFIGYASFGPLSNAIKSNHALLQAISPSIGTVLSTMTALVGGNELTGVSKTENCCVFFSPLDNKSISFVFLLNADSDAPLIKLVTQFNGIGIFVKKLPNNWYIVSDDKISLDTAYNNSNELIDVTNAANDGVLRINLFESAWNGQFQFLLTLLKKHELFLLIEEVLKNVCAVGIEVLVDGEEINTDFYIVAKSNLIATQQLGGQVSSSKWADTATNMNLHGALNLNNLQQLSNYLISSFIKFFETSKTNNFPTLKALTYCWNDFNEIFSTISKNCIGEFSSWSDILFKGSNLTLDYVSIYSGNWQYEEFMRTLRVLCNQAFPSFFKKVEVFTNQQIATTCNFFENVFSSEEIKVHELDISIKKPNNTFICNQKSYISLVNGNILITDDKTSTENYIRAILGNKTLSTPVILSIGQLINTTINAETFLSFFGKKYASTKSDVIKLCIFFKNNKFYAKINSHINTIKALINIKN